MRFEPRKAPLLLAAALLLGVAESLYFYPLLPDTIAVHFDAAGTADRFGDKNAFFQSMGTTYALLVLLFGMSSRVIRSLSSGRINLPNKEYWLAPARRDRTIARIVDQTTFVGAMALLLMDGMLYMSLDAGRSPNPDMPPAGMWVLTGLFLVANVGSMVAMVRHFKRVPKAGE